MQDNVSFRRGLPLYSNSKSSNLSRYFMIFRLILLPTLQVTKSSKLLVHKTFRMLATLLSRRNGLWVPTRWICDRLSSNSDMTLLYHLGGGLYCLGHSKSYHREESVMPLVSFVDRYTPGHDNWKTPACKGRDRDVVLDGAELWGRRQNAHVVELLQE